MWIRSQDKETLKNCEIIYIDQIYKYSYCVCGRGNTDKYSILGVYSTKEKALKVLDMIQGCITGNALQSYEIARDCPLAGIEFNGVFIMPQDNEVE